MENRFGILDLICGNYLYFNCKIIIDKGECCICGLVLVFISVEFSKVNFMRL